MAVKVGINGFGRIGRMVFRAAYTRDDIEFLALNDLTDPNTLAHLLKYDSVHGILKANIGVEENAIVVNGKRIQIISEKDPGKLPWKDLGVDIVFESTGLFRDRSQASKHLNAGAKKVIISAPAPDPDITLVIGVNHEQYDPIKHHIISNASCTTNSLAPICKVLLDKFGIKKGLMTTIHSYTTDQRLLDFPHRDLRRARAAGVSMIPTTTGAAKAVSLVLPELAGKMNGMALRVPTPNVSLTDLVVQLDRPASAQEVNKTFEEASQGSMKGIIEYCDEPLVSTDFNGITASTTVDALSTMSIGEDMVKILAWYDNEFGYANRLVDLAVYISKSLG
ncbi:MAG: type I glyceraldehyde-3-phosphate dehydrogenase [Desulfobacterium sp. 4572_20]|nr:type I glyceraldehyde-3-phosphate dehydrogenase [Deltaproteobacteria bacterium]OQY16600.1 MAG: type I glyceraldehyde-3-phosphate dehydrogenase [Desulfobacterium sp. 4572_20]RLB21347.1 MAG: type I glyceraldehyde-3-phosphate dehydrogenase [Deltaproteobacteria bacterium]RLJ04532.1 MAG: type I glyceraldehyde-3-phosphate dehydrogenase [Candidatus Aenigmarchaeota archaeon]